jgi:hypothetical protein
MSESEEKINGSDYHVRHPPLPVQP